MGVGAQRHAAAGFTPGEDLVPILQEALWAPGSVWTDAQNLTPTGIRSPDLPARSESPYRLSYRGPLYMFADGSCNKACETLTFCTPDTNVKIQIVTDAHYI